MLNSGKKFRVLRDKKNNILTLVLSEKKILNETNPPPLFKLNGRSLTIPCCSGARNICCVIVPKILTSFV